MNKSILFLLLSLFVATQAFVLPSVARSQTALQERRWNFNDGQEPWGLKKNAEIWNGRVSQMAFIVVFAQELIQGKGVLQGLSEGNPVNYVFLGLFVVSTVGLTAWLAIQGKDSYVDKDLGRK